MSSKSKRNTAITATKHYICFSHELEQHALEMAKESDSRLQKFINRFSLKPGAEFYWVCPLPRKTVLFYLQQVVHHYYDSKFMPDNFKHELVAYRVTDNTPDSIILLPLDIPEPQSATYTVPEITREQILDDILVYENTLLVFDVWVPKKIVDSDTERHNVFKQQGGRNAQIFRQ